MERRRGRNGQSNIGRAVSEIANAGVIGAGIGAVVDVALRTPGVATAVGAMVGFEVGHRANIENGRAQDKNEGEVESKVRSTNKTRRIRY